MVDSSAGPGNVQGKAGASFTARKQGSAKKNPKLIMKKVYQRNTSAKQKLPVAKGGNIWATERIM